MCHCFNCCLTCQLCFTPWRDTSISGNVFVSSPNHLVEWIHDSIHFRDPWHRHFLKTISSFCLNDSHMIQLASLGFGDIMYQNRGTTNLRLVKSLVGTSWSHEFPSPKLSNTLLGCFVWMVNFVSTKINIMMIIIIRIVIWATIIHHPSMFTHL